MDVFGRFSTQDLALIAILAAALVVSTFLLGQGIVIATGVPFAGGIISALLWMGVAAFVVRAVPKPGAVLLLNVLGSVLAAPTPNAGPPGIYKVVGFFIAGLFVEAMLLLSRRRAAVISSLAVSAGIGIGVNLYLIVQLGLPGAEKLVEVLGVVLGVNVAAAAIGAAAGWIVYNRVDNVSLRLHS